MERIVVGVDGSDCAAAALLWALHESELRGCALTAVMVWDYLGQHHPDGSTAFEPSYNAQQADEALNRFVVDAVGESDSGRVGTELMFDLAARGMVEASKTASLLVLGARGLGGFRELLLGSVGQRCLHEAACPVAIVRTPRAVTVTDHGRVVVGVDGSPASNAALRWAGQEALYRGAELTVVHAAPSVFLDLPLPDPVRVIDVVNKEANAVLEHALADLKLPTSVKVHLVQATDSPAKALLQACLEADLVVVGRAGRGLLRGRLLGSVATQISHHSTVPAVFVSSHDAA